MATFRRSQIGELTGSTGSLTFSKNKSGGIVKFKSTNKNRNTVKQAQNRNSFSQSNGGWHTLTDEQKMSYENLSKKQNITGLNLYLKLQNNFKIYKSILFLPGFDFLRAMSVGSDLNVRNKLNKFNTLNEYSNLFDINNSQNEIVSFDFAFGTPIATFWNLSFKIIKSSEDVTSTSNYSISSNFLRNKGGLRIGLMFYYQIITGQKVDYKNNKLLPFFSLNNYNRSTSIPNGQLTSVNYIMNQTHLNNLINKFNLSGKLVKITGALINESGFIKVLNSVYHQF